MASTRGTPGCTACATAPRLGSGRRHTGSLSPSSGRRVILAAADLRERETSNQATPHGCLYDWMERQPVRCCRRLVGGQMSHDRTRARLAGLVAVSVAAGAVALGGSAGAAQDELPGAGPSSLPSPARGATVTLLTGDRVTLGGPHGAVVRAAKGRERIGFVRRTDERGDVHVIPRDAVTLVSSGRLDPRLFDVSELARTGYGDTKSAGL